MHRTTPAQTDQSRWSHPKWLLRWLLLVLVVVDLVGSPFHDHVHDMGIDGRADHAIHVEDFSGDWHAAHLERTDGHRFSHSLAALPSVSRPTASSPTGAFDLLAPAVAIPWLAAAHLERPAVAVGRHSIPTDRFLRPEGRAPPALHI